VRSISFPRYTEGFFGELIGKYLRGEFGEDPSGDNPYLISLPFACDRWEAAPKLRRWLGENQLVVCNRYVAANIAHQGGKLREGEERDAFRRWVEQLEYQVFETPRPDLNVWLDMPPEVAVELIGRKGDREYLQDKTDIHEGSFAHLCATREVYHQLASGDERWCRIECVREGRPLPEDRIAEALWDVVRPLLT
jgi:dTMP kinase